MTLELQCLKFDFGALRNVLDPVALTVPTAPMKCPLLYVDVCRVQCGHVLRRSRDLAQPGHCLPAPERPPGQGESGQLDPEVAKLTPDSRRVVSHIRRRGFPNQPAASSWSVHCTR